MWTLLLVTLAAARADIAPPQIGRAPDCDARRCPGQEVRWCRSGAGDCPDPLEGWTLACTRGPRALSCRDWRTADAPPAPDASLAALPGGGVETRARLADRPTQALPAITGPGGVQIALPIEGSAEGWIRLALPDEAVAPVLTAPLSVRAAPGGPSLGALAVGTPVEPGAAQDGWHALAIVGGPTVFSAEAPVSGRTYPSDPARTGEVAPEHALGCGGEERVIVAAPEEEAAVLVRSPGSGCLPGWQSLPGAAAPSGWLPVEHAAWGLRGWVRETPPELLGIGALGGLSGAGLGSVAFGGGEGDVSWHTVRAPRWLYPAPGEAPIGRITGGKVAVDEVRSDGWWRSAVASPRGPQAVWLSPYVTTPTPAAAVAEEEVGCATSSAPRGLWLLAALAVWRRRQRRAAGSSV